MDAYTRAGFMAWSNARQFKDLVLETTRQIETLAAGHVVSVAVSGGKDSLVLLALTLEACPRAHAWHWDYGIYMPRPIEQEVLGILYDHFKLGARLHVDARTTRDPNATRGYKAFFAALSSYLVARGITMNLVGLRAEESCARKRRCKHPVEVSGNVTTAFPLAGWRWRDVWAFLVSRGIPYPSTYDARAPLVGWDKARFVTFFDPEFEHLGGMVQDKFQFWKVRT